MALRGFFAWLAWLGVHLIFLLGMRNRFTVFLIDLVLLYVAGGARIITKKLPGRRDDEVLRYLMIRKRASTSWGFQGLEGLKIFGQKAAC